MKAWEATACLSTTLWLGFALGATLSLRKARDARWTEAEHVLTAQQQRRAVPIACRALAISTSISLVVASLLTWTCCSVVSKGSAYVSSDVEGERPSSWKGEEGYASIDAFHSFYDIRRRLRRMANLEDE